jgi:pimeloyl-ACP methyl ester carboxylesterase
MATEWDAERPEPRISRDLSSFRYGEHRLSYEVYGEGSRVVVLLHAMLMDANINRRLAATIAASGYRVVLLDLLGHGGSDKPRHASAHRMDIYARQVVALLDELGVDEAVVGGVSLGADVALLVAVAAPERVRGLILEMPVLEFAAPAAALLFVPTLLVLHYLGPVLRVMTRLISRAGPTGVGLVDGVLGLMSSDPDEAAAVLHGVLLGPIAPTVEQREGIQAPSLVIGHRADPLHAFSDADRLARQLPRARLLQARSIVELRLAPRRLTTEVMSFLNSLWGPGVPAGKEMAGAS